MTEGVKLGDTDAWPIIKFALILFGALGFVGGFLIGLQF